MKPFFCRLATGITLTFNWFMSMVDNLFNKHKLVRRSIVFIALALIGYAVYKTFNTPLTSGDAVKALIAVLGLLTPVLAFYKWQRDKDGD